MSTFCSAKSLNQEVKEAQYALGMLLQQPEYLQEELEFLPIDLTVLFLPFFFQMKPTRTI